jgi:hypothetical protein
MTSYPNPSSQISYNYFTDLLSTTEAVIAAGDFMANDEHVNT